MPRKKRSKRKNPRPRSRASNVTSADIVKSAPPLGGNSTKDTSSKSRPARTLYLPIAEKKYGYPPPRFVVIHHLDENPFNQDPPNLVYLPRHIHYKLHMWARQGSLIKYADEIIQTVAAFRDKAIWLLRSDTDGIETKED